MEYNCTRRWVQKKNIECKLIKLNHYHQIDGENCKYRHIEEYTACVCTCLNKFLKTFAFTMTEKDEI